MKRGRKPKTATQPAPTCALTYSAHLYDGPYEGGPARVWRENWFGDQFEILEEGDFKKLQELCKRFCLPLKEQES